MAIEFARVERVSRSSGGNACRKGAYNARCIIEDKNQGIIFNFVNRDDNVYHEILLPERASKSFKDTAILMNEVERLEKRKDSQLLKEYVLALPDDKNISLEMKIEMIHEYIRDERFVEEGLGVQIDIHQPHDGENNWHAHLLVTTRRFSQDGKSLSNRKAVDLEPQVRSGKSKAFIADRDITPGERWRITQDRVFSRHGLENRVDLVSNMPQEHIGPVRMRAAINQAVIRNQERMQANIESIRDGRNVLARVTKNSSVFSENDVRRVLKCVDIANLPIVLS